MNVSERAEAEWKYDLNASYNHELQSYTAHRSENVRLHGGHLIIQARPQKDDGYDFTSGRLISKRAWAYGKFEARAKLPRGKQLWPAIWMLPQKSTYGNYAADGEIDIMEYWGDRVHEISGTLHYGAAFPSINASLDRQISVICHNHNTKDGNGDNNANNNNRANNNIRRPYPSEISPTSNSSADSRNQQSSGTADSSSTHSDDRDSENCVTWAKTPSNKTYAKYVTSSPSLRSSAAVPPETIEKRRRLLRSASCKKIKLDLTRLDSRPHGQLQPKKIFKPNIICAPCGKTIGFCRKALLCADCHSVCHPSCASQLTLPCIPHYTPKAVKSGVHRKIVVSHFIDQSVRPFVPAILVHLCTEIERRGLGEEGLYRKCGSHRQIRQLKAKRQVQFDLLAAGRPQQASPLLDGLRRHGG
ncbi:hypothetical protein TYRP_020689 [Tyrophagus putrescentiae]|nr:hypothetical protein TYRP_020689 [Tyrophagus putrescentiae]